ncbi:contact-dependent growth inhibition system immunity protein [Streptomyces sp. NPDC127063]|uniref:contact-dependent growth inhibition system immunity protein n=1 Tax=Streptomyces sp. NPDC127063 TaxID=3347123 RepID=UPI0036631AA2
MTGQGIPDEPAADDALILDVGLSWLASKSAYPLWLSDEDHARFVPAGPVEGQLDLVRGAVGAVPRAVVVQIGEDARRLLASALPDEVLRTVWLGTTKRYFDPEAHGMTGRQWLARIEQAWTARISETDTAFVPPAPRPVTDPDLRRAVLEQIGAVADGLERAAGEDSLSGLVPALEQVVTEACADVGFRLFLRAVKAYFVAIDEERCEAFIALGERFGYPEFLVDDNLNVG